MSQQVSVLIRTRNRPDSLKKAIESVLHQTYEFIEIIVVNDAGQPFEGVLSELDFQNRKVKIENLKSNVGRGGAANVALGLADSNYALFLDDDDFIETDHLTNLMNRLLLEDESVIATYSGYKWFDEKGERSSNKQVEQWQLITDNQLPIHSVLFRLDQVKTLAIEFDSELELYEDWDFWLQLAVKGRFIHTSGLSAHYHANNASGIQDPNNPIRKASQFKIWMKWRSKWPDEWYLSFMEQRYSSQAIAEEMQKQRDQIRDEANKVRYNFQAEVNKLQAEVNKLQEEENKLQEEVNKLQAEENKLQEENLVLRDKLKFCPTNLLRKAFFFFQKNPKIDNER